MNLAVSPNLHLRTSIVWFFASCLSLCGVVLNQDDIAAGKLGRPVGNVERLLKQLQSQKNINEYSLVIITNTFIHKPLPVIKPGVTCVLVRAPNIRAVNPNHTANSICKWGRQVVWHMLRNRKMITRLTPCTARANVCL
jgi:hypothetical protein